ncbi:Pyruvate/Phosphoenolpyruvate kinase-like domain-containing protein [Xylariales sp. PMI_506]|nr:Pyruvate/Phosphoenolpyruvate kinase-like domain-containing protein [Xylariales sp. PMI_506]
MAQLQDPEKTRSLQSAAGRLRTLLNRSGQITVCPGVYDGLTARIALRQGFGCLYMTGAGTAISRLGMPDLGIVTLNDMLANASMIASLDRTVPLIADADTGYGGPIMVARTVKSYMAAGIAGLHLEDQVLSKRCGHLLGKEVVDQDTFLSRIRAAVLAREEEQAVAGSGSDIVIIARSDALQVHGYEEAMSRLEKAIAVGADVAFLEGPTSKEQCREACRRLHPTPVLLNMVPGGVTPNFTVAEAQDAGFRLMIHPGLMLSAVYESCTAAGAELKETGTVSSLTTKGSPKVLFEICGLKECIVFDKKAGGHTYSAGV